MVATKSELLDRVRTLWKTAVGHNDDGSSSDLSVAGKSLWDYYQVVSNKIPDEDDWMDIGSWAFYQSLDELSKIKDHKESGLVSIEQVTIEMFDRLMSDNLSDPTWLDERVVWNALPIQLH